jgi:hypothetical protein
VTDVPDRRFVPVVEEFLRGDHSVPEFIYAFRRAMGEVVQDRALSGVEVELFHGLEEWETAGWHDRPQVVDRLRRLARDAVDGMRQGVDAAADVYRRDVHVRTRGRMHAPRSLLCRVLGGHAWHLVEGGPECMRCGLLLRVAD